MKTEFLTVPRELFGKVRNLRKFNLDLRASLVAQMVKPPAYNAGDSGSVPGSGRSAGEGNGNPFQYSCLENFMDRGT